MQAIWHRKGQGWELLSPKGFSDEARLHSLVEEAPHLLPLSGSPSLVVIGREVQLGLGYADLLAIEPDGRIVIIEIKLARNSEARRAVVSQVLAYAAHLHGLSADDLELRILRVHLKKRGYTSLAHAVESNDQEGSFEGSQFQEGLRLGLREGRFRLVIVLDSAPAELVRLVGYLEAVSDKLVIDLVTASLYEVGDSQVLVPQRVDPEHQDTDETPRKSSQARGELSEGVEVFVDAVADAPAEVRERLDKLVAWAQALESEGLVTLSTYKGVLSRWTLLPRLQPQNAGLVTIWYDGDAAIQLWRSVFDRCAPEHIEPIEKRFGLHIGQGNTTRSIDDELLAALTESYRAAAGRT